MNTNIFEDLTEEIRHTPQTISMLHRLAHQRGSNWTPDQLRLLFECAETFAVEPAGEDFSVKLAASGKKDDLTSAVYEIVAAAAGGKPVHPSEIRKRLPGHFITTEEQIKAIARNAPNLELFGPGLLRVKN